MTQALTIRNDLDVMTLGNVLAQSGYFQDARDAAQAVVKVLYGQELGIGAVTSMMSIHIIQGKPAPSAGLLASIIKRSKKYNYRITRLDNDACEITFLENGDPCGVSSFTRQDAERAGAFSGRNQHTWKAFTRNMLFSRAISNGARWYCADVFGGPVYTPEELDAPVDEEGNVIEIAQPAPPLVADTAPVANGHKPPTQPVEPTLPPARPLVTQLRETIAQARAQGVTIPSLPMPKDMTDDELYLTIRDLESAIVAAGGDLFGEGKEAEAATPPKRNGRMKEEDLPL